MSLSQMSELRSEFAGTFPFLVRMFPLTIACWQVGTILCLVPTPCLCSAKSHTALQRDRACFRENQMAENMHSQTHTLPQEDLSQDHIPTASPKGAMVFADCRSQGTHQQGHQQPKPDASQPCQWLGLDHF